MPTKPASKRQRPQHHPEDYDLDILSGDDDMFRWFLLCYMLGKPIQSSVAVNTWRVFIDSGVDTPWAILDRSERQLAALLHQGKYTRYQHVMSHALHECMRQLVRMYEGSIMLMLESSADEDEFSKRLQELYGVGPKTAQIIMRETSEYFARRVE